MEMFSPCPEASCTYPLCLPCGIVDGEDRQRSYEQLQRCAPDLFALGETTCSVRLHQYAGGAQDKLLPPVPITTASSLRGHLEKTLPAGGVRIFTIYRFNSWSRMQITLEMFQMLCAATRATSRMVDLVRGMRFKSAPRDDHFVSCYRNIHHEATYTSVAGEPDALSARKAGMGFQVCYNLRHFEKHGRDLKNPWSCRQSVVHQSYTFTGALSSWIIIQPPNKWQAALDGVESCKLTHPLSLHLKCLGSAMANSWEHLEYLSSELLALDQLAAFPKPLAKFEFNFTLNQKVHSIRKRLYRVKTILDGTSRTAATLSSLAQAIRDPGHIAAAVHNAFAWEIDNILNDLRGHMSTTEELLNLSSDIKHTINSILSLRNQEILNDNGAQLHRIAEDNSQETRLMSDMAKRTYDDSRSMRIATVIALLYVPASLVLSFFSTVFVEIQRKNGGVQLLVYDQTWIAVVSVFVLILFNGGWFWFWNRARRASSKRPTP